MSIIILRKLMSSHSLLLLFVFAVYSLASSLHVANQREGGLPISSHDTVYHVSELGIASVAIISATEGPTWSIGSGKTPVVWQSVYGVYADLQKQHLQILAWFRQYILGYLNADIGLRKVDLIYPFHYFW